MLVGQPKEDFRTLDLEADTHNVNVKYILETTATPLRI